MKCRIGLSLSLTILAVVSLLVAGGACIVGQRNEHSLLARVSADPNDPVAVISYLPNEVSNGTWQSLSGENSHAQHGILVNFTWKIEFENATTYMYYRTNLFKFTDLGLYKISLTVADNASRTGSAFTAVYSILDSDGDSVPDWWEINYFEDLNETGTTDPDGDGYSNLQEYASGTDPTAKDPQPGLVEMLAENWLYLVVIAAAIVAAVLILLPRYKKKQDREVKKKIEVAIEIEHELEKES